MFTKATPGGVVAVRTATERAERARPSLSSWSRVLLACLAFTACDSATEPIVRGGLDPAVLANAEVQILGGEGQEGVVGDALPNPLVVAALDANGNPLPGAPVTWTFGSGRGAGHGNASRAAVVTLTADAQGLVSVDWELGTTAGPQVAWAEIGTTSTVTKEESAAALAPPADRGSPDKGKKVGFWANSQPSDPSEIVVSPTSLAMEVGQSDTLTAVVLDQFGNETSVTAAWTSSDPAVATVSDGDLAVLAVAVGPGDADLVASYEDMSAPVPASVSSSMTSPVATEIVVSPTSLALEVGQSGTLTAVVLDQGGNEMTGAAVEWTSSDPAIITVASDGNLSAVGVGSADVLASYGGLSETIPASVQSSATGEPAAPAVGNLFSARWTNGTGDGTTAVTDGGRFSNLSNGQYFGDGTGTLDVVSASSVDANEGTLAGYSGNVLRMRMREASYGQMTALAAVPEATTHYGRVYYRSDAGRRSGHGSGYIASGGGGSFNHWQILSLEHHGGGNAGDPLRWAIRTAGTYPQGRFYSPALAKGTWYRFEWQVEYVTATTVRVWPRIYDIDGNLIADANSFRDDEGRSSLADFWASNTLTLGAPDDAVDTDEARDFTLGLEDPSDAIGYDPATPAYIYVTGLDFSSSGWMGS